MVIAYHSGSLFCTSTENDLGPGFEWLPTQVTVRKESLLLWVLLQPFCHTPFRGTRNRNPILEVPKNPLVPRLWDAIIYKSLLGEPRAWMPQDTWGEKAPSVRKMKVLKEGFPKMEAVGSHQQMSHYPDNSAWANWSFPGKSKIHPLVNHYSPNTYSIVTGLISWIHLAA